MLYFCAKITISCDMAKKKTMFLLLGLIVGNYCVSSCFIWFLTFSLKRIFTQ